MATCNDVHNFPTCSSMWPIPEWNGQTWMCTDIAGPLGQKTTPIRCNGPIAAAVAAITGGGADGAGGSARGPRMAVASNPAAAADLKKRNRTLMIGTIIGLGIGALGIGFIATRLLRGKRRRR